MTGGSGGGGAGTKISTSVDEVVLTVSKVSLSVADVEDVSVSLLC